MRMVTESQTSLKAIQMTMESQIPRTYVQAEMITSTPIRTVRLTIVIQIGTEMALRTMMMIFRMILENGRTPTRMVSAITLTLTMMEME